MPVMREAIAQTEAGAHALDVNVGLPEINEPAMSDARGTGCAKRLRRSAAAGYRRPKGAGGGYAGLYRTAAGQ